LILNTVIVIDGEALGSDDPASVPRNVLHSLSKALDPAANHDKDDEDFIFKAVRGEEAVNEYGATAENFYQAFPCEFPLAKGLTEGISGLPLGLARHLYLQHSCKAAHDSRIYFYAFNMLQRHTAATNAGIRLKNTTDCVKRFMSIVNTPGFLQRLRLAKLDPESKDARGWSCSYHHCWHRLAGGSRTVRRRESRRLQISSRPTTALDATLSS
jgi:hypothetical protein